MRKLFITLITSLLPVLGYAQIPHWQWAKSMGAIGSSVGIANTTDTMGNVYVAGGLGYDLNHRNVFIGKYNSNGSLLWMKQNDASINTITANATSIVVDRSGNVYAAGIFEGSAISFDNHVFNWYGFNYQSAFIVKYDKNGVYEWCKKFGAHGWAAMAIDTADNIYLASTYTGIDTIGSFVLSASTSYQSFLTKIDKNGTVLWANSTGDGINNNSPDVEVQGIHSDAAGNIYTTGYYSDTAILGADTVYAISSYNDGYLAKYDKNGNGIWAISWGAINAGSGASIRIDGAGNIYNSGILNNSDVRLAKYDSNGQEQWEKFVTHAGNNSATLCIDSSENIYIAGLAGGGAQIDTFSLAAGSNSYVAKYDSSGHAVWVIGEHQVNMFGVCINRTGDIYITGAVTGLHVNLGTFSLNRASDQDLLLAKLSGTAASIPQVIPGEINVRVFPNPSSGDFTLSYSRKGFYSLNITDPLGKVVYRQALNPAAQETAIHVSQFATGVYNVMLTGKEGMYSQKIILQH